MSSEFKLLDNNFLPFLFNEDLYIVREKDSVSAPAAVSSPVAKAKESVASTPRLPVTPKLPQKELKKIAVVAASENEIQTYQEFLSKILQAVGISWSEAGFVAHDKPAGNQSFENFIIFGIENLKLVDFKSPVFLNQVQQQDTQKFIFTYSLPDLEKNKDKKKGLWTAMQEAFLNKK